MEIREGFEHRVKTTTPTTYIIRRFTGIVVSERRR